MWENIWKLWLLFARGRIQATGSLYRYPQTEISACASGIIVLLCMFLFEVSYKNIWLYAIPAAIGYYCLRYLTCSVARALQDTAELMDLPEYMAKYRDIADENYSRAWERIVSCKKCPYFEKLFAEKHVKTASGKVENSSIKQFCHQNTGYKETQDIITGRGILGALIEHPQVVSTADSPDKLNTPAAVIHITDGDGVECGHGAVGRDETPQQRFKQGLVNGKLDLVKQKRRDDICGDSGQEHPEEIERAYEVCRRFAFTPCWVATEPEYDVIQISLKAFFAAAKSYFLRANAEGQVKSGMAEFVKHDGNVEARQEKDCKNDRDGNVVHVNPPQDSTRFFIAISFPLWIGHLLADICFCQAFRPVKLISVRDFWNEERELKKSCFCCFPSDNSPYKNSGRLYDLFTGFLWLVIIALIVARPWV